MKLSIGNKIRALRRERGITQEQLAASIGITFQAVSKWENDIALPDITLVPALREADSNFAYLITPRFAAAVIVSSLQHN